MPGEAAAMSDAIMTTELPGVSLASRGKVRDIYDLGDNLLIIATDRISAFDVILPTPIPDKGRVLTGLSRFWFGKTRDIISNHLLSADSKDYPALLQPYAAMLAGRSMLVKKAEVLPIECVVRGYLAGSGWKEYREQGTVCDIALPAGLRESDKLPEPMFTPSTKATSGHDENISPEQAAKLVGEETFNAARQAALALYQWASDYAAGKGIILADTKFEFGLREGELILVDEALTPDSSRFWEAAAYVPGKSQDSFDKQYVRDWLESINWNKQPPAPELPAEVVEGTRRRYREAYERICGHPLQG
jgi:phosphoribosylaminoimidazole-succinocarboxamide synthase